MNIVYIAESAIPSRSANSIQVMRMCQAFAQQGAHIELVVAWQPHKIITQPVAFLNPRRYYGLETVFPIRFLLTPVPPKPQRILGKLRKEMFLHLARSYILKKRPELVYTRSLDLAVDLVHRGVPVAVECHEYELFRDRGDLSILLNVAHSPLLRLIVVISENLKRLYVDFGLPEAKMLVAHDGVDAALLDSNNDVTTISKMELGIPESAPVVCYAGKMSADRGVALLLDAATLLPKVYFVFVGGTTKEVTMWQQRAAGMANVVFTGFVFPKDVVRYLEMADVLVAPYTTQIPTLSAASPLKVFEYMATGKPAVISKLPTIQEIAKDGYDAILVEPDFAEALIAGLKRALEPVAKQIGANARKTMQQYTWQARAQCILGALPGNEGSV